MKKPTAAKIDPSVVSAVRAFFSASEHAAFTAAQAALMCRRSRRLPANATDAQIAAAIKKLAADGHLSRRADGNGGEDIYQVTPLGISAYEAGL